MLLLAKNTDWIFAIKTAVGSELLLGIAEEDFGLKKVIFHQEYKDEFYLKIESDFHYIVMQKLKKSLC